MTEKTEILIRKSDRERLRGLKESEYVQAKAIENDIIDLENEDMSYEQILDLVIPDDDEALSWEIVKIHANENGVKNRINTLAGDRVAAHDVVNYYLNDFAEDL